MVACRKLPTLKNPVEKVWPVLALSARFSLPSKRQFLTNRKTYHWSPCRSCPKYQPGGNERTLRRSECSPDGRKETGNIWPPAVRICTDSTTSAGKDKGSVSQSCAGLGCGHNCRSVPGVAIPTRPVTCQMITLSQPSAVANISGTSCTAEVIS